MKLAFAAPLLAKLALSSPFVPPPAVPVVVNEVQTDAPAAEPQTADCSTVWDAVCTGTNSNGEEIYGSYTCGARVQYNFDFKLGRTPTMSAAIAKVLSECPGQCGGLANNQCDVFANENLVTVSEADCSATWDATCTNAYGTYGCGERVKYDMQSLRLSLKGGLINTHQQCGSQCQHINPRSYNQCAAFFESKANEPRVPAPMGTCQEAIDRVCSEGYKSYTCGARVEFVFNNPTRSNAITRPIGEPATIANAVAEIYRQCPNDCQEFQNGNCDAEVALNFPELVSNAVENDDYEDVIVEDGSA